MSGEKLTGGLGRSLAGAALVLLVGASSASAATVTVTTTADNGAGSLRQLIDDASDADVVVVPAGTYTLLSEISIGTAITIRGAGARSTIISGADAARPFFVSAAADAATFERLTIRDGYADTDDGGAIETTDSDLNLNAVALLDNRADETSNNRAGAIRSNGAVLISVRDSLIAGNTAYNGGATDVDQITLVNTTLTGNTAGGPGANGNSGGLRASEATIRNSTIAGNRCFNNSGCGGGVDVGTATIRNSIVADNIAYDFSAGPPDTPGNPGVADNCDISTLNDLGNSLEDSTDCGFTGPGSQQGANPLLVGLADNGGQTDTLALLAGSDAIGEGQGCEASDQRGLARALAAPCDIGAYERVLCGGVAVNRFGTSGKDTVVGTSGADGILGLGGNDLLKGLAGKDSLCGGKGRDRLLGGKGRDKLIGGKGRDRLRGGPGRDLLRGGPGRDNQRQ